MPKPTELKDYEVFDEVLKRCKSDRLPVQVVCELFNYTYTTFMEYLNKHPEAVSEAQYWNFSAIDDEDLIKLARSGLVANLTPQTITRKKITKKTTPDGEIIEESISTESKLPSITAIKFVLENLDSEHYGGHTKDTTEETINVTIQAQNVEPSNPTQGTATVTKTTKRNKGKQDSSKDIEAVG